MILVFYWSIVIREITVKMLLLRSEAQTTWGNPEVQGKENNDPLEIKASVSFQTSLIYEK